MNTENIQKLISSLKGEIKLTRHMKFDMANWRSCIGGNSLVLMRGATTPGIRLSLLETTEKDVADWLDISYDKACNLFYPEAEHYHVVLSKITRKAAIKVLKKLLETGRVEWKKVLKKHCPDALEKLVEFDDED